MFDTSPPLISRKCEHISPIVNKVSPSSEIGGKKVEGGLYWDCLFSSPLGSDRGKKGGDFIRRGDFIKNWTDVFLSPKNNYRHKSLADSTTSRSLAGTKP